jgi:hypothetical protein
LLPKQQHPCMKAASSETGAGITNKLALCQRACWRRDGDLAEQLRRLKPCQTCWYVRYQTYARAQI